MRHVNIAKGHGTGNDFVIVTDRSNLAELSADDVVWLCDRHFGIGGDGVLRAVKAAHVDGWDGDPDLWFMDYRNSDGSIAEMCGNGLRVFARYLIEEGLCPHEPFAVATRAGLRRCEPHPDGTVTVDVGRPSLTQQVTVVLAGESYSAQGVDVGNPHAVVLLDEGTDLASLPVHDAPTWHPAETFPGGVNVEFVTPVAEREIALRVHERGSGETLSCGTGIVAAVAAYAARTDGGDGEYTVSVPGGTLTVSLSDQSALLRGPAVIVARGQVYLPHWS